MTSVDITVPVPSDRIPEFYRVFADWIEGGAHAFADESQSTTRQQVEQNPAQRWWLSLNANERAFFGVMIDTSPRMVTGEEVAQRMGLESESRIGPVLSWSRRKGEKAGLAVWWEFRQDPITGVPMYGIEDTDFAEKIRKAREAAEA
ncbi:hypothetical protein [Leifsonia shinshuensis]|uniref:Uncharacterized protein n=1 Tax=Leifsonia shinshuensis TaxID=150026 RepID=A0A7G6YBK3_9MICO|nr:hypothetical protein [Leifsonia shinshuensis]QNE35868.1 hypothetical protein F1C12_12520 [Leifsonia shinshuensis]